MACDNWDAVSITDCQLSKKEIEQLVGMAVAEQVSARGAADSGAAAAAAAVPDTAAAAAAPEAASPPAAERSSSMDVAEPQPAAPAAAAEAASTVEAPRQLAREGSATVDEQPAAMQMDEAEAPAAAAGAAPVAADGTVAQPAAGEPGEVQQPWMLRAEHLMAAAEALRKLQAEAAAQPEKQALKDVALDQFEKQLLSEVRCAGGGFVAGVGLGRLEREGDKCSRQAE